MSDRVDTNAVRARLALREGTWAEDVSKATVAALCDELERTREALREARVITSKDYISVGRAGLVVQMGVADDILRAALAESGNTEGNPPTVTPTDAGSHTDRCPTCGSTDPATPLVAWGEPSYPDGVAEPYDCDNAWHRATDTEGEK